MTGNISHGAGGVRATREAFEEIGADELIFSPAVSDPAEIDRLARGRPLTGCRPSGKDQDDIGEDTRLLDAVMHLADPRNPAG
jgi:hypothetical protein